MRLRNMMNLASKRGVAGAILMTAAHLLVCLISFWCMLYLTPRYEKQFSDYKIRLPATTEVAFAVAHRLTGHPELLPVPLLFFVGVDATMLLAFRWHGEKGWSWLWFLLVLAVLLLPMALMTAGIHLAEWKLRQTLSR
jgi:hypothetical protein